MKGLQRVYAGLLQDLKSSHVWVITVEIHYDQSLIYLETAYGFVVGTAVHISAPLTQRTSPRALYILF